MKQVRTKSGAAAFYIVAFSTLLLSIIALSFVTVIISEIVRTTNSDLSASAYDSALAGIEDAKAALLNYQSCINQGYEEKAPNTTNDMLTCEEIIWYMNHPDCDMVGHILGRIRKADSQEVLVEETTTAGTGNNLKQAYTCVKIQNKLNDYRSSLTSSTSSRAINISLTEEEADDLDAIRLSWYSNKNDGTIYNYGNTNGNKVTFPALDATSAAVPPTLSFQLFQTSTSFTLNDLTMSKGSRTDRGTIYLVPTASTETSSTDTSNHLSAWDSTKSDNIIGSNAFVKANDKTATNVPYTIYCPDNSSTEFACTASIAIPRPIGDSRNPDTFMIIVSLPYGVPDTDFAIELCTESVCSKKAYSEYTDLENASGKNDKMQISSQVLIDSTGRANDLFRRVEVRLDNSNSYFSYPDYALQLLGNDGTANLQKDFYTTSEYDF